MGDLSSRVGEPEEKHAWAISWWTDTSESWLTLATPPPLGKDMKLGQIISVPLALVMGTATGQTVLAIWVMGKAIIVCQLMKTVRRAQAHPGNPRQKQSFRAIPSRIDLLWPGTCRTADGA